MNSLSALHEVWAAIAASPGCCRLLAVSVEVAVLAVAVWCLIRVLRIRSARVCSLLWILVLAKGLFGLAFGAPLEVGALRLTESAKPSQSATAAMSAEDLARQEAEMQRALREAESSAGASVASAPNGTGGTQPSSPAIGAQVPRRLTPSYLSGFFASLSRLSLVAHAAGLLTAVWLAGVLWALLATALDLRRIRGLARASGAPSEELLAVFRAEAARLGIARVPALSVCAEVESPALAGLLRPTVLAPAWLAETADPGQLRWMLAHELMHYKQKDTVGLLVRRAAQVALWFHPAVWWAGRQWEEAMERACDRALIAGEADARLYAEQLHGVLKSLMARRSRTRVVTGLFATRTQIGKRIAALLTDSLAMPARLSPSSATLVALFAAAALSFGVGIHRPAAAAAQVGVAAPAAPAAPTGLPKRSDTADAVLTSGTRTLSGTGVDIATGKSAAGIQMGLGRAAAAPSTDTPTTTGATSAAGRNTTSGKDWRDDERFSEATERTLNERRIQIRSENLDLGDHPWAGEYHEGDGLGVNITLLVAPTAGYLYDFRSDVGPVDRNYGAVTFQDGKVHLSFTFDNKRERHGIAEEFLPVSWGERHYLIPPDRIEAFCNDVNSGTEPRAAQKTMWLGGAHLLRRGDREKAVEGLPDLPAEHRDLLLQKPIESKIIGITTSTLRNGEERFRDYVVRVRGGKEEGLTPDMKFLVVAPKNELSDPIVISKVGDGSSVGTVTIWEQIEAYAGAHGPKAGWKLSTVHPGFQNLPSDLFHIPKEINTEIDAVETSNTRPVVSIQYEVKVLGGQDVGLRPGMQLYVVPRQGDPNPIKITQVGDKTSEGVMTKERVRTIGTVVPVFEVGWKLSTHP